jgi:hypothetical protein
MAAIGTPGQRNDVDAVSLPAQVLDQEAIIERAAGKRV